MPNVTRRLLLASLAAVAAVLPLRRTARSPVVTRVEPPDLGPVVGPPHGYVNIFNRSGRSYEIVPLDEDGRLPPQLRHLEPYVTPRRGAPGPAP